VWDKSVVVNSERFKRLLAAALLAVLFGGLWSIFKGNASGIRDAAGNLSAPWVILPLVGGALAARGKPVVGALVGLAMTFLALSAFYFVNAFVLDLGPHSTLADISLTMNAAGNIWFRYGILSGVALGGCGAWVAGRSSLKAVGMIAAAFLVLEPFVLLLGRAVVGLGFAPDPLASALEVCCGMALAAMLFWRRRARDA